MKGRLLAAISNKNPLHLEVEGINFIVYKILEVGLAQNLLNLEVEEVVTIDWCEHYCCI